MIYILTHIYNAAKVLVVEVQQLIHHHTVIVEIIGGSDCQIYCFESHFVSVG